MIAQDNVLVVDIDGTLCPEKPGAMTYADLPVEPRMLERLTELRRQGWHIVLHSARGMRSNGGNPGKINVNVVPTLLAWLERHDVPYDEIVLGKPWAGRCGYYIDDRAVRPREFLELPFSELDEIIKRDRVATVDAIASAPSVSSKGSD